MPFLNVPHAKICDVIFEELVWRNKVNVSYDTSWGNSFTTQQKFSRLYCDENYGKLDTKKLKKMSGKITIEISRIFWLRQFLT